MNTDKEKTGRQRRRLTATCAQGVAVFAFLSVFICVHPCPNLTSAQAAWPKHFTYAAGITPRGLNPLLDRNGWNELSSLIVGRLVRPDHRGGIEGDLAESWKVSADGRTYTLQLRRNAVWHDGAPFTAEDVLFTWQKLFDDQTESTLDLNQAALQTYRKDGKHGFVFLLKQPDTGFLAALTEIGILPAHKLRARDINGNAFDLEPVGTGPYKLVSKHEEWLTRDGAAHFMPHQKYHLGKPAFESLTIRVIASDDERARAIADGSADLGHVKPPHVLMLRAAGRRVMRMRTGAWRGMPLNLKRPALQDVRVRQAIDLAIDRKAIVREALQGYGAAGYSPIPPASWAYRDAMNQRRHDPQRAAALLEAAGWRKNASGVLEKNGQPLRLEYIIWKDEFFHYTAGHLVQKQLAALGFDVKLHLVDGTTYNRLAENMGAQYDGYIGGWGGLLDPGDNLYKKYHSRGSQNRNEYRNTQVDTWLEEARRTTDRARATDLYARVVEAITRDAVFLPLAYPDYLFAVRPGLTGIEEYILDSWYEFTKYAAEWKPK